MDSEDQVPDPQPNLDAEAIEAAADMVSERIDNGEIRSLQQLGAAIQSEVAFQKIAIRNQPTP